MDRLLYRAGWWIILSLSVFLFAGTALYFSFRSDFNFLLQKRDVVFNLMWRTSFYIHIAGGMTCLITGPLQFLPSLRNRNIALHRSLGKAYVGSILLAAGPAGLFMAFYANGGPPAAGGFMILSLLWMYATWKAVGSVKAGDIPAHRRWMTRSFALTFAAVTLRIWVPVLSAGFHVDPHTTVVATAWLSWIPNLLLAELLLWFDPEKI